MDGSDHYESSCDQGTPFMTPYLKLGSPKSAIQAVNMDLSPSSGGDGSGVSLKEGSGSPSSSSSDSESESINLSVNHSLPMNTDDNGLLQEIRVEEEFPGLEQQNQTAGEDNTADILRVKENLSYEMLLRKFVKNEEELRISNLKLQLSEKEVIRLKSQIERCEVQLDHVQKELQMREADLEQEKGQVLKLQNQTSDLETHVPDCCYKIAKLVEELEAARELLKVSDDEISRLKNEVCSLGELQGQLEVAQEHVATLETQLDTVRKQIEEQEERIVWYKANESDHEHELLKLKAEMLDAQARFSSEKELLQSDISRLSEEKIGLESRLREWELRGSSLENKLMQFDVEKLKVEELHAAEQMVLQGEVNRLKEELDDRRHEIEVLNKEFDQHKHKYDMLMTEKDEASAKIHNLLAEVSSRDNRIDNVERELCQLQAERAELILGSETRLNLEYGLKLKVEELEKEVASQKTVISDRAEEKREAIRQLCFSLEHYRSGYKELREAITRHKCRAVVAS